MPTPFMHLDFAERMQRHPRLPAEARALVADYWPAFCLGSIAPDYQVIADIPREQTHFYPLPIPAEPTPVGMARMLADFPALRRPSLETEDAVFVAGYGAHLLFDVVWYRQVLQPYFLLNPLWEAGATVLERFVAHNILLTYLDGRALARLAPGTADQLSAAHPRRLAPFLELADLARWQVLIAAQLQPGAPVETVAIYAGRLRMSPAEFAARLADPDWMAERVFRRAPLAEIEAILEASVAAAVDLTAAYLAA